MELIFYFFLSFLFPFIWVFYLFKKDRHPEPFSWLFLAFLLGIIAAFLSLFSQKFLENFHFPDKNYLYYFIAVFLEELFKFLLIRIFIFSRKVFDEPIDAMIYMVFSAFGFAFIENFGVVLSYDKDLILSILFFRFLGANLLHILASSLIGFGYALSIQKTNFFVFLSFLLLGTILHFIYNLFIIKISLGFLVILPILGIFFLVVLHEINFLKDINERNN